MTSPRLKTGAGVKLTLSLSLACLLLGGCVSRDMSDLESYAQEVLARPGGRIEPLPEIRPYEAYAYQSGEEGARNPFKLFYKKDPEPEGEGDDAGLTEAMAREIHHRNREELEQFELDSLDMVGTLEDGDDLWAIVRDPDGVVHRVAVGNYMGRNIGKITNIYEDHIELREIIKDSQGRWQEREAAIALSDEG
ncbi:type IV pilus assembly protein PilP [Methylohalomonas lacus]|uniref:Type IV pilus assembly protein PilP n=1 Tax=Methylohalomonas lacus TaxID=398773 RepID=A0AAE3HNZ2_9GAMM|nr:pilus assembly protein PilP [Methylohalomonas lacus]MCS3904138.1 type IV pilus assembly protein PilP [Methylohalomonas lacus]